MSDSTTGSPACFVFSNVSLMRTIHRLTALPFRMELIMSQVRCQVWCHFIRLNVFTADSMVCHSRKRSIWEHIYIWYFQVPLQCRSNESGALYGTEPSAINFFYFSPFPAVTSRNACLLFLSYWNWFFFYNNNYYFFNNLRKSWLWEHWRTGRGNLWRKVIQSLLACPKSQAR